ncbi:unnamed protein product [marine sediment metagenome]|uniref:Sporulation protein Cse60 n=1 Tax=marine sediment metagenome TaxID=412755 RepID=X1TJ74_9ZZZZ
MATRKRIKLFQKDSQKELQKEIDNFIERKNADVVDIRYAVNDSRVSSTWHYIALTYIGDK